MRAAGYARRWAAIKNVFKPNNTSKSGIGVDMMKTRIVTMSGFLILSLLFCFRHSSAEGFFMSGDSITDTMKEQSVSTWNLINSPVKYHLEGVALTSSSNGWAVGLKGYSGSTPYGSVILHWDGNEWREETSPTGAPLFAVTMISENDGWAVGGSTSGVILHWNGSAWSVANAPSSATLYDVKFTSANDGWAIGGSATSGAVLLRWNGTEWTIRRTVADTVYKSVAIVSVNNVWVVGRYGTSYPYKSVLSHWNGSTWSTEIRDVSPTGLNSVAMVSSNDGWAVGRCFMHYDGSWTASSTTANLSAVTMNSTNDGWAVGSSGSTDTSRILHWDGNSWSNVVPPSQAALSDIAMISANEGWAVGWAGTILYYGYPKLAISKTGPSNASVGEPISYTLTITNSSPISATEVIVTDTLPTGAYYVNGGTMMMDVVRWTIPHLAANSSTQVHFVVTATQTITNSVYGVSCIEGASVMGTEAVVTKVGYSIYLPLVIRFP